jgi:hypothetical protein
VTQNCKQRTSRWNVAGTTIAGSQSIPS